MRYMPPRNEPFAGETDEVDDRPVAVIRASSSPTELLQSSLRSLWQNRNLLREMTLLRLKVRYRQSLLGWLWAILPPLVLMIVYTVIFSHVLGVKSGASFPGRTSRPR